jgi:hypothetical protein
MRRGTAQQAAAATAQDVADKAAVASRTADLKAELLAIADLLDPPKLGA